MTAGHAAADSPPAAGSAGVRREPLWLLGVAVLAVVVSAWGPSSWGTWALEVAPVVAAVLVLVPTYRRFRFTPLVYRLLTAGALLIALGAYYTYAQVPAGFWLQDWLGLERNHYDRIGHVFQGVIAALVVRELLRRHGAMRPGWWLFGVVTFVCLGISGAFEVAEAMAAAVSGQAGTEYLGTQGDVLDAQWDTTCALVGAIAAQALFSRTHEAQLRDLTGD